MEVARKTAPSITSILKKTSDEKTLALFNNIALSNDNHYVSPRIMLLSTKQYYSRMSGLINSGLVKKSQGKYSLTLLGKIVYEVQLRITTALSYHWKLKVIESIQTSISPELLPKEEMSKLVDALIDNHQIKDVIRETLHPSENSQEYKKITSSTIAK